jgi:hypothetical protein
MVKKTGKQKAAKKATTRNKRMAGKQNQKAKSRLAMMDVKNDHQR